MEVHQPNTKDCNFDKEKKKKYRYIHIYNRKPDEAVEKHLGAQIKILP